MRDEDDSVGQWTDHFRHIGSYGHGMGGVAGHWDEDDEAKTCSASNYERQITATMQSFNPEHFKPPSKPPSEACIRAVFNKEWDKLCSECKEDTECYLRGGAEVARETPQCMSNRRRLGWKWRPRHPKAGPRGFTAGRGWDQDDDLGYGYGRFL